jgi:hypothetical protein
MYSSVIWALKTDRSRCLLGIQPYYDLFALVFMPKMIAKQHAELLFNFCDGRKLPVYCASLRSSRIVTASIPILLASL